MASLEELREFSEVYHCYESRCQILANARNEINELERQGAQGWYNTSDDDIIASSREISQTLDEAQAYVETGRNNIQQGIAYQKRIKNERLVRDSKNDSKLKVDNKKATRNTVIFILVWIFAVGPVCAPVISVVFALPFFNSGNNRAAAYAIIGSYLFVLAIGALILLVFMFKRKRANGIQANLRGQEIARASQDELSRADILLERQRQEVERIASRLDELSLAAAEEKKEALERAQLLLSENIIERTEKARTVLEECDLLYEQLKRLNTIPREADWPSVDMVISKIESGRADSLKEALQLVDNDERHKEAMAVAAAQLQEQVRFRKQFGEEMGKITALQQQQISQRERHHEEEYEQRERHRKEQRQLEVAQLVTSAANYAENCHFHEEVRKRWS